VQQRHESRIRALAAIEGLERVGVVEIGPALVGVGVRRQRIERKAARAKRGEVGDGLPDIGAPGLFVRVLLAALAIAAGTRCSADSTAD